VTSEREVLERVLAAVDLDAAVDLVQQVCRIPSVLGAEGALAAFLAAELRRRGYQDVELQPVLVDRPNAVGELRFGAGPRVVLTGHMDTKPESHGWSVATPYSGEIIGDAVYGHGIMDMKAALACMIVAGVAVRESGLDLAGTLAFAAVSDHMGDQRGSIAYFDAYDADMCLLGELSDNEIFLGHRGRYYFDVTALGRSAHTCHKSVAVNANVLAAHAVLALDASSLKPALAPEVEALFGAETFIVPGRIYGGLPPGGPSMIPDECVVRVDCRPQPGIAVETVRAEIDRCLEEAARADPAFRAEVVLADVKAGYLADAGSPVVRTLVSAVRGVRGTEPVLSAAGWLGDTASFGAKVPTVIFGPGGEPVYCADEHLSIADIHEATKVYAAFAALALTRAG
jgi:acetylornithine deacetylase